MLYLNLKKAFGGERGILAFFTQVQKKGHSNASLQSKSLSLHIKILQESKINLLNNNILYSVYLIKIA